MTLEILRIETLLHCYMLRAPIWALIDSVPESSGWNVPVFVWREPEEAEGGWSDWRGRGWEDCAGGSGEQLLCQPKFWKLLHCHWWAFLPFTKQICFKSFRHKLCREQGEYIPVLWRVQNCANTLQNSGQCRLGWAGPGPELQMKWLCRNQPGPG